MCQVWRVLPVWLVAQSKTSENSKRLVLKKEYKRVMEVILHRVAQKDAICCPVTPTAPN